MAFHNQNIVPKSQGVDSSACTFHYFHSIPLEDRKWNQGWMQIISIDPAHKNFAMRIERRFPGGKKIIPIAYFKADISGDIVAPTVKGAKKYQNKDISQLTCTTFSKLNTLLNQYTEFYPDCHYVLVERQMPQNHKMVKVMQHIISYFSVKLLDMPLLPHIVEVDPKLKNVIFGFGKVDYSTGKKKGIEIGRKLLIARNDQQSLDILTFWKTKIDDLTDCLIQLEAFCRWMGYDWTFEKEDLEEEGVYYL
jgi:hypothetical protein